MWADSHCHVPWRDVPVEAFAEARSAGVGRFITVGTDAETSAAAIQTAAAHPDVWATVGLHPHEAHRGLDGLPDPAAHNAEVVAIGECGLDYHYDRSPRDVQRAVFAEQVRWAHALGLTLVIHTREAWADTFAILDDTGVPPRTVFHCFTGGVAEADSCLERGAYLSFSGIVTFKAADEVRAAVRACPLDRILVETDTPYLAPAPHRGRPNRPALVPIVGAAVAAAKDISAEAVEAVTWENTARAFALPA